MKKQQLDSPSKSSNNEIFDVTQAVEFLKIPTSTLYTLTSQKKIPYYKRGKKLYFKKSELQLWIDKGKKMTQDEFDGMSEERLYAQRR